MIPTNERRESGEACSYAVLCREDKEQLDRIEGLQKVSGVKIGKYILAWCGGDLEIYQEGGEGGFFNEKDLEAVIEIFYIDNF